MTKSIGTRIRRLRTAAGMTQAQLGYCVGLSKATIGKLENDRLDPRVQTLQALASVFDFLSQPFSRGCSVPYLLYGHRGWWAGLLNKWPVLEPVKQPGNISAKVDVPHEEEQSFPRGDPDDAGHRDQQIADAGRGKSE